jgi:hypothetical protein
VLQRVYDLSSIGKNPNGLGKKATTQSDRVADQGESPGRANEVEAFD